MSSRILTLATFLVLIVNLMAVWWVGNGVPLFLDVGETSSAFLDGWNRVQFGFWNAGLLHDEATGPDSAAHPYIYSHSPNFPRLVSYVFTSAGFDSLPAQHLFTIAVSIVGLIYGYFFVKRLLGRTTALVTILLAGTDYLGILQWAPNLLRSFNIITFFGAFYYALRWRQERASWCLIPLAFFVFFIGLNDISFAAVYIAALFFFLILGEVQIRRLITALATCAVPLALAFGLYVVLLVRELGWSTLWSDVSLTYAVRNLTDQGSVMVDEFFSPFRASDIPFLEQTRRFFIEHHITFWVLSNGSQGVLGDFLDVAHRYGVAAHGPLWYVSLAGWGVALGIGIFFWFRRSARWRPDAVIVGAALLIFIAARLLLGFDRDAFTLVLWLCLVLVGARPLVARLRLPRIVGGASTWVERVPTHPSLAGVPSGRKMQRGFGVVTGGIGTVLVLLVAAHLDPLQAALTQMGLANADIATLEAVAAVLLVLVTWASLEWVVARARPTLPINAYAGWWELATATLRCAPDSAGFLAYVAAFTLGILAGLTVLGGYLTTFTLVPYRTLLVFLDLVLLALVVTILLRLARHGSGFVRLLAIGTLAVGTLLWGATQITNTRAAPALELTSGRVLREGYRGKSFVSNVYPSVVSYYTREWSLWITLPRDNYVFLPENVHDLVFPFQADYWSNPTKYERPQYYLCDSTSARNNAPTSTDAAPDTCRQRAAIMAQHGHVPEVVGDYFAIVRLTYSD